MQKLQVLDLFSGIGGFSLGLERTGGFETAAFCEIEDFPRQVLARHWPEVPCYEDVRTLTAARLAANGIAKIDVITGGFPCQDVSTAGRQAGIGEGTRSGLWSEIVRLVREIRPKFVIVENVANLLRGPVEQPGRWFGRILGDMAECGYDAEWENIPAAAVGAPHRRERIWIVAYPSSIRRGAVPRENNKSRVTTPLDFRSSGFLVPCFDSGTGPWCDASKPEFFVVDDGLPEFVARLSACGNAGVPQIPELIGHAILQKIGQGGAQK